MIGRKDMKQETMAKRTRDRAASNKMMSPRKKMDMGMSPGAGMGAASAPPMMPMGMKKGGKVDFSKIVQNKKTGQLSQKPAGMAKGGMANKNYGSTEDIVGTGKTKAAAKADYAKKMKSVGMPPKFAKGGMAEKGMKGGGMMLVIGLGKKKGK